MKDNEELIPEQTASEPSNAPLMWMHLTWLPTFFPVVPLFIWRVIRKKNPHAEKHYKNILNASFTFFLFHTLSVFTIVCMNVALISFDFIEGEVWWSFGGVSYQTDNPIPTSLFVVIYISVFFYVLVSTITVGVAARKGQCLPYWWGIRFFRIT